MELVANPEQVEYRNFNSLEHAFLSILRNARKEAQEVYEEYISKLSQSA